MSMATNAMRIEKKIMDVTKNGLKYFLLVSALYASLRNLSRTSLFSPSRMMFDVSIGWTIQMVV